MIISLIGRRQRGRERGTAVIIMIMLLGIMVMYIAGNAAAIHHLKREVILMEKKQERARLERIRRVAAVPTNSVKKVHGQNPHD